MSVDRPVLRWHGGKFRLAPWIIDHFPKHRVYCEPFGGAGSVLMRKPRVHAEVYNDLDDELVNLFRILRDKEASIELERLLRLTPFARSEMEEAYTLPRPEDNLERARQLVLRTFMGHGADSANRERHPGFRGSRPGSRYYPAYDWANYWDSVKDFTERLQGVVIESRPAVKVMESYDAPDTLHYVDPPYFPETRQVRQRKVYAHEMDLMDHLSLANALKGLKGMVILSLYRCDTSDGLYAEGEGWHRIDKEVFGEKATARTESLYLNAACMAASSQLSL